MVMEILHDDRHRALSAVFMEVSWATGIMILALYSWCLKSWRWIQLCFSLSSFLSLFYIWMIPESFRWLMKKQLYPKAEKYLTTAAKFNKKSIDSNIIESLSMVVDEPSTSKKYTVLDMFKTPNLRKRSFILFYVFFSTACGYYGLSLNASRLAGNKYLNYFINGAVDLLANLNAMWVLYRFGRRLPLASFFLIGGTALVIAGTIPSKTSDGTDIAWLSTLLAWIGKFSTAACWSVVFLYANEIYPTLIRNVGVGACAFCARIGSLVAPQVILLGLETEGWVSVVVLAGIEILAGLLTLLLPETMGKILPDTIEQAENLQSVELHRKHQDQKTNKYDSEICGDHKNNKPEVNGKEYSDKKFGVQIKNDTTLL